MTSTAKIKSIEEILKKYVHDPNSAYTQRYLVDRDKLFECLPTRIIFQIFSFLDIYSLISFATSHRHIYKTYYCLTEDPSLAIMAIILITKVIARSLQDPQMMNYFPEAYQDTPWVILGKTDSERIAGPYKPGLILIRYMLRILKVESDIANILALAKAVDLKMLKLDLKERARCEKLMQVVFVTWTQSHIFGSTLSETEEGEITNITSVELPRPPMPHNTTDEEYQRAEYILCSSIDRLIWPEHTRPDYWKSGHRQEWDFYICALIKLGFIRSCYPGLLLKLIQLRKPIDIDSMAARSGLDEDQDIVLPRAFIRELDHAWQETVNQMRYWLRQVIKNCPGSNCWDYDPNNEQLLQVWAALREHRGFDRNEEGPEGPEKDILPVYMEEAKRAMELDLAEEDDDDDRLGG